MTKTLNYMSRLIIDCPPNKLFARKVYPAKAKLINYDGHYILGCLYIAYINKAYRVKSEKTRARSVRVIFLRRLSENKHKFKI